MAIIYRCDGCDKEFKEKRGNLVSINIERHPNDSLNESKHTFHDFCRGCNTTFERNLQHLLTNRVAAG